MHSAAAMDIQGSHSDGGDDNVVRKPHSWHLHLHSAAAMDIQDSHSDGGDDNVVRKPHS